MRILPRTIFRVLFAVVWALLANPASAAPGDNDWRPVEPAELSLKSSTVEKDADAEALFWEVKIDHDREGVTFTHYVRIKIFTERGKETQSKIQIPFGNFFGMEIKIKDIAARTIKADGTVVELKKEDVFETTQVRLSGAKVKVKSFALPGIEPGAIIDYRWREERPRASANYLRLQFQRNVPTKFVKYLIKPYPYVGFSMRAQTFHGYNSPFVKEKDGFYSTTMSNMQAFTEERYMPPEDQVRTWMLLYYSRRADSPAPSTFWNQHGRALHAVHRSDVEVSDEIRKAATEAIGDASTAENKLERLFNFVRAKVENVNDDALGLTPEERAKVKQNKSPTDSLKRGKGTAEDIDMLFAALASAAGFDARVVELPNRNDFFFDDSFPNGYFLRLHAIAVRLDDGWRFFDPASRYCPYGMLPWWKERVKGLVLDSKDPVWVVTPLSPPEKSLEKRTGTFRLLEDGTLEGDVQIEFIGHLAMTLKEAYDEESTSQREESVKGDIKRRLSTAEVSDIKIENVRDAVKPLTYSYHVRVPGYAQRTGKRLFLQPGFFEHGVASPFSSATRKHEVYFSFPWSEKDHVTIELPPGFVLDNPETPAPITPELTQSVAANSIKIGTNGRILVYERYFYFGGRNTILFPVANYAAVKRLFDMITQANEHTITLRENTGD